jgi:hypothetical protein
MSSLALSVLAALAPLLLATAVVLASALARRAGVRIPRMMRAGPWPDAGR